jgi:putative phosphoesterase
MKVGILSDSHDRLENLKRAAGLFRQAGAEALIHAGDFCSPFCFRELAALRGIPFYAVFGNNDGDRVMLEEKSRGFCVLKDAVHELELDGRKLVVMHYPDLAEPLFGSGAYDLVVYGHTHRMLSRADGGRLLLNPGTCAGYLAERATVALWDTAGMEIEILRL